MTKYHSHGVQPLSNNQMVKLANAFPQKTPNSLLLSNHEY